MTDFSTIPIRSNNTDITASWWNTIRTKLIEMTDAPTITTYANDAAFVTAKGSAAAEGDYYANTTDNTIRYYDGTAWREIIFASVAQVLTAKDIDGGTASNTSRLTLPKDTTTNLDLLTDKEATIAYDTSLGSIVINDGTGWSQVTGAGGGGINHIDNSDAETGTAGWATYADAAGTSPVDGTGGAANITFTRNTTSPLRGAGDFKLTKDAVNRQGEGASYDFTIDPADNNRTLAISADIDASHASYADGDLRVYIYDVTNTTVIEPAPVEILGGKGEVLVHFQSTDSTSYRLIFHVASTNASAYDVYFDNVTVSPAMKSFATPVTDPKASTASINWTTNTTHTANEYRVGKYLYIEGNITLSGAPDTATLTITLPHSIDSTVFDANTDNTQAGSFDYIDGGVRVTDAGKLRYATATTLIFTINDTDVTQASPITWASTDEINYKIKVPIAGWGASVQVSDHSYGRVVASKIYRAAALNHTSASGWEKLALDTTDFDTHSQFDSGNNRWVAPFSGYYQVNGGARLSSLAAGKIMRARIYKNGASAIAGSTEITGTTAGSGASQVGGLVHLLKGDYIELFVFQDDSASEAYSVGVDECYLSAMLVSGLNLIAPGELTAARYSTNAGLSINNATHTTVVFEDVSYDTHGAYNTGTGIYTVPASGKYTIDSIATFDTTTGTGATWANQIWVNSTLTIQQLSPKLSATGARWGIPVMSILELSKGDLVEIRVYQNSGGAISLSADNARNTFSIARIG